MILKSNSCFSRVLRYLELAVVGELGSDVAMWPWFLLLVLVLAFRHLVISGASWYCCLWLEFVPPVGL